MLLIDAAIGLGFCWLCVILLNQCLSPKRSLLVNIPGPPPLPVVGNVLEMMGDPLVAFAQYRKTYGPIFKYYYFTDPVVVISDPAFVKTVLNTNSSHFDKDRDPVITAVIGHGLLLANGEPWKRQRKIMNPSFGNTYLKRMVPCFVEVTRTLLNIWKELPPEPINLHIYMTKVTLDVIGISGFGYAFNSLQDSQGLLPTAVSTILLQTEERIFQTASWWKIPFLPSSRRFNHAKAVLLSEIRAMIKMRKESDEDLQNAKDLLGRLLAAEDPDTHERLDENQLADELITFLIAGHETTAASLAFTCYLLSQHPDVEQKVIDEIDEIIGTGEPTYDDIQKLKYLPMVMKESMRLFPSVSMQTTRITNQDTSLEKDGLVYHLPKGTYVEVWPWLLHRADDLWDDPLTFNPERFASGSFSYKYTPFGEGPRNCIGQNLALMESKVVLVMIYQHYRLRLGPGAEMKPQLSITLRPAGLLMQLIPRRPNEKKKCFKLL